MVMIISDRLRRGGLRIVAILGFLIISYTVITYWTARGHVGGLWTIEGRPRAGLKTCFGLDADVLLPRRRRVASITDYGAVGDGATLNTGAFQRAMEDLSQSPGGALLIVPRGRWLTGCFNLTSHLTLFLQADAVILASKDPNDWPLVEPLPSYGRGRERLGKRHTSLLHGDGLVDVWVTGENGTIDGQGLVWWDMWRNHTLKHTRGHLVEFINSSSIVIYNVVLQNSPFWTLHPVYCNNVIVKNVTILAPWDAPNTDGIDPDSTSNVCIEDCYISNGDDLIAIKSGWDEYGIHMGIPSTNITIRRVVGTTSTCSGIAIGSEVSGGISNVEVDDVLVFNTNVGIRIKTAPGRGGYITNITINRITMNNIKKAIEFSGDAGDHPNDDIKSYNTFSVVKGILIKNVVGFNITHPGRFISIPESPFDDIYLLNISLDSESSTWHCSNTKGFSDVVNPKPCPEFSSIKSRNCTTC